MRKIGEGGNIPEMSGAEMSKKKEIPLPFDIHELLDFLGEYQNSSPEVEAFLESSEVSDALVSSLAREIDYMMPIDPPVRDRSVETWWLAGTARLEQARIGAEKMAKLAKGDNKHLFEQIGTLLRENVSKREVLFRESGIDPLSLGQLAQSRPAEERGRAPWIWLEGSELDIKTLRADKEVADTSLQFWMDGKLLDADEATLAKAVRVDDAVREKYRELLVESIKPLNLVRYPDALNYESFFVLPLPHLGHKEALFLTSTDNGPILRWKDGSVEASGWDVAKMSAHIDDVVGDLTIPISVDKTPPVAFDAWQAVKATKRVEHDPEFPEDEAVRIADSVSSLLVSKDWLDKMQILISSAKESSHEEGLEEGEALLANAIEARAALEAINLRYVNLHIIEFLHVVDEAYEKFREAVSKLDEEWYVALVSGTAVDKDSWWGSRARELGIPEPALDLEGNVVDVFVDTHLTEMRKNALSKKK